MIFKSKKLSKYVKIKHSFFSKKNGFSKGIYKSLNCGLGSKDINKNINKNLNKVKKKIKARRLFLVNQIHSNKIILLKKIPINTKKYKVASADGIFTSLKNIGIGILSADCAPILIFDKQQKYICCIHAGWKGAHKNIISKAINLFNENKVSNKNILICIGPCISEKSYEVKKSFYKKIIKNKTCYKNFFIFYKSKIFFNLRLYIKSKILETGVKKNCIFNISKDTFANSSLFYSYRRSILNKEKDYGRNISTIIKYD